VNRWTYLWLAVGAGLGAALTAAVTPEREPVLVGGVVEVPFELNGSLVGTCEVTVEAGVVGVVGCDTGDSDE